MATGVSITDRAVEKIKQQLAFIPGVIVGINVELNPEVQRTADTYKLDTKPFPVSSTDFSKDSTSQSGQIAGRPGAQSNGVGNNAVSLQQTAGGSGGTPAIRDRDHR